MAINIVFLADHPEYADQLAQWFKDQWGQYHPERDLHAWSLDLYFNRDKLPLTLLALEQSSDHSTLVGTATLCIDKSYIDDSDAVWLKRTYVPPEARGKDISTKLIKACITITEHLKQAGQPIHEIMLLTRSADMLYKKFGWEELKKPDYLGGPVALMTRKI